MPTSDAEPSGSEPAGIELSNGQRFLRFLESTPNIVGCVAGLLAVVLLFLVELPGPIGVSAVAGVYLSVVIVTWLLLRRTRGLGHEEARHAGEQSLHWSERDAGCTLDVVVVT